MLASDTTRSLLPTPGRARSAKPARVVDSWLDADERRHAAWRALCLLFLSAAALGALLIVVEPVPPSREPWFWLLSGLAAAVGAVGLSFELRAAVAVEVLLYCGLALVSVAVVLTEDGSSPWVILYVWIGAEGALLLQPAAAIRLNVLGVVAYALVLLVTPVPSPFAIMTVGSIAVVSAVAWMLRPRLERLAARLHGTARIDPMTGLLNRRGCQETLTAEMLLARRTGTPVSVVVGDLDHFKALNELHGHARGDEALQAFADVCRAIRRGQDVVARTGAKQFALALPGTDAEGAQAVAERLRESLGRRLVELGTPTTTSFGIATYPKHGRSAESLLDAADQARCFAQERGRDRVVVYSLAAAEELSVRRALPQQMAEQLDAVLLLAETLDLRDPSTAKHSQTVGTHAEQTARGLGLDAARVQRTRLAGLLQDVGKIGVPDAILHKPAQLTPSEFAEMQRHAELGARILTSAGLADLSRWVHAHHERPDGRGYPGGKCLGEIPLEARILSVCDSFEAMTADRVYSPAMPIRDAVAELRRCAGTQFDESVVEAFVSSSSWTGQLRIA